MSRQRGSAACVGAPQCGPGVPLATGCDPGVRAIDPVEGDLSVVVNACLGGSTFARNGLRACGFDTHVPGPYEIEYWVRDSATGEVVATTRTLVCVPRAGPAGCAAWTRAAASSALQPLTSTLATAPVESISLTMSSVSRRPRLRVSAALAVAAVAAAAAEAAAVSATILTPRGSDATRL